MDLNIFDAIIISITIILGIKGFFNGIVKEISGLIGIGAGIYTASIYYEKVGNYINEYIFKIPNESAINIVGFISVFVSVWLLIVIIGMIFSKILSVSSLGIVDRLGGFFFSAGKFFIILAVIVTMLSKIEAINEKMQKWTKDSLTYPFLIQTGEFLINLKPEEVKSKIDTAKAKISDSIKNVKEEVEKINKGE